MSIKVDPPPPPLLLAPPRMGPQGVYPQGAPTRGSHSATGLQSRFRRDRALLSMSRGPPATPQGVWEQGLEDHDLWPLRGQTKSAFSQLSLPRSQPMAHRGAVGRQRSARSAAGARRLPDPLSPGRLSVGLPGTHKPSDNEQWSEQVHPRPALPRPIHHRGISSSLALGGVWGLSASGRPSDRTLWRVGMGWAETVN